MQLKEADYIENSSIFVIMENAIKSIRFNTML